MTRDEFIGLLNRFAERPLPATTGRHIYVWQGTLEQLSTAAPRGLITVLDLHALCQVLDRTPNTPEAARKTLAEAIGKWLERELPRNSQQRVLAVTGCDLLMRYAVPLGQFAQQASENRLIALVVPAEDSRYRPAKPVPAYVRLQPEATVAYFKSQMADDAVIGGVNQMARLHLNELLVKKPVPVVTLNLLEAYQKHAAETVETYIFTGNLQHYFEQILESVAQGRGQGFWVQAEYGAGKTHFLATLAALLADTSSELWDKVDDDLIRQFQRRLKATRLLPVVLSLRGEASADTVTSLTLLDVLLDKGFRPALEHAALMGKVKLTSAEDLMEWYDRQAPAAIRTEFEAYIQRATTLSLKSLRETEGPNAAAELLAKYLEGSGLKPNIAVGVKDRLASIYRQLEGTGHTGLLVIIDEYEGWSNIRFNNIEARAKDEDLLETLSYLLPKDLGMAVHAIVASQTALPTKLRGGQAGDRFINLPLLASQNERDYDVIASRRVRGLNPERLPEIKDYYRYYAETFEFAKQLSEADFSDVFPFQPRCFEIVRRITARDLPGPRSGIRILYEVVNEPGLLARTTLIRASDLMFSRHLVEDCLSNPDYKPHYNAYRLAQEALPSLGLDAGDFELAQNLLTTLYLWYEAFYERPRPLSFQDLAQATLTSDEVVKAEHNVQYVLSQMQSLQQIQIDNQGAQFVPAGDGVTSPITLLKEYVKKAQADPYPVASAWTNSLFMTSQETNAQPGLFAEFKPDEPVSRAFDYRNLQYQGEVVVASRWQIDWGMPLTEDDIHFRVVILTAEAATVVQAGELQDPRIAVIYPAPLTDEAQKAAAEHLAWVKMSDEYKNQTGKDADAVRDWLREQRRTYLGNLLQTQLGQYKSGQVVTRDDLAIAAKEAFGAASNEQRLRFIVEKLLAAAYPQLPLETSALRSTFTAAEAGKLFEGYFSKDAGSAQVTATKNYGVGLGLSHSDQPALFAPQENCKALAMIGEMLDEQRGSELAVWKVLQKLSQPPYGLPYIAIQFYLLAFVRRNNPRVDLLLKRDHRLKLRDGKAYPRDRLSAAAIADIAWNARMLPFLDVLLPSKGPNWNDVLSYARQLVDDLRTTTDQAVIEAESSRLTQRLANLGKELPKQHNQLAVLERALHSPLPAEAQQTFGRLTDLTQLENGYASFFEKVETLFASPDGLRDVLKTYARLRELAEIAAEVAEVKGYLDRVRLREGDRELRAQRDTLLAQISLNNLQAQPHLWGGIKATFESQFKGRYRNEYQKHHRDANAELKRLSDSLADVPRQLNALKLLNSIQELGPARGDHLAEDYARLMSLLQSCSVANFQSVSVEAAPVCAECGRDRTYAPPTPQVQDFQRELAAALTEQQRRLASETIRRVLERAKGDALSQFMQAAQAANVAALVDALDENIVKVVRKLLAEEQIGTAEGEVIGKLLRQYGSLEEADIPEAVKTFETLLREAFTEAKKANKGKKTIRLTLK